MRPNLGAADGDSACAVVDRRGVRVLLDESVNATTQRRAVGKQFQPGGRRRRFSTGDTGKSAAVLTGY